MSIQRKRIREKMVEILRAGATQVGEKVYGSRARAFFQEELPAVCVYFYNETVEEFNASPRELKRTAKFRVEVLAKADEDLDNLMDEIGDEVEKILHNANDLDGLVNDLVLSDSQAAILADGEQPVGSLQLTFDVEYLTLAPGEEGEVAAEVSPFRQVRTTYRPNGAGAQAPQPGEKILLEQEDDANNNGIPDEDEP